MAAAFFAGAFFGADFLATTFFFATFLAAAFLGALFFAAVLRAADFLAAAFLTAAFLDDAFFLAVGAAAGLDAVFANAALAGSDNLAVSCLTANLCLLTSLRSIVASFALSSALRFLINRCSNCLTALAKSASALLASASDRSATRIHRTKRTSVISFDPFLAFSHRFRSHRSQNEAATRMRTK